MSRKFFLLAGATLLLSFAFEAAPAATPAAGFRPNSSSLAPSIKNERIAEERLVNPDKQAGPRYSPGGRSENPGGGGFRNENPGGAGFKMKAKKKKK